MDNSDQFTFDILNFALKLSDDPGDACLASKREFGVSFLSGGKSWAILISFGVLETARLISHLAQCPTRDWISRSE